MTLTSPAFSDGGMIPPKFTCEGKNGNPELLWSDLPAGTKSLVLIMDDPDVPTYLRPDGIFVHWLAWNIPPTATGIPEHSEPDGVIGLNTARRVGYAGPCPPDREHRYFFRLYALDALLDIPDSSTKDDLLSAIERHLLAQAELMGRFEKKESTMNPK